MFNKKTTIQRVYFINYELLRLDKKHLWKFLIYLYIISVYTYIYHTIHLDVIKKSKRIYKYMYSI